MLTVRRRLVDYVNYVPPQDSTSVLRLVGFVEYSVAIDFLDQFLNSASSEERQIAEDIVAERPEFSVFTNLSRKIQGTNSFLGAPKSQENDRRQGLKWVTALARVEVGAMLSGFSSVPEPFAAKPPTQFDVDAYQEILLDGYRTMFWSTTTDQILANSAQVAIPKDMVLIELRRVVLARAMGAAFGTAFKEKLTPVQLAELMSWDDQLKRLEIVLLYCLSKQLGTGRGQGIQAKAAMGCPPVMAAAQRAAKNLEKQVLPQGDSKGSLNLLKLQLETLYPQLVAAVRCE